MNPITITATPVFFFGSIIIGLILLFISFMCGIMVGRDCVHIEKSYRNRYKEDSDCPDSIPKFKDF